MAAFDPVSVSGSFLLDNTHTYELSTFTALNSNDGESARLDFDIPGVTAVNIFVPEPSVIYLLGIGLTSLRLVRKRLEKGKERTYRAPQECRI
jgi:hypothetical protein